MVTGDFQKDQIQKRESFVHIIHSAFILNTSVSFYLTRSQPTDDQLLWLFSAYPDSDVKTGTDQGARYCHITPKF